MTKLSIAPKLSVPLDVVTETLAILGIRGSGKTNTAVVLAEELLANDQQVVVIDPTDVWYGLKSSGDGEKPGYPVIVLGGRKAELPLGAGDGAAIADVVVDHGASLILALRHFASKADMRRFITDFAERLYYRKGQLDAPTPLMLIIDEASLVVPQNVMGESARMVGSIQQLVRQGRSSGIGVTLIDQRAASVNKDVLTQLEVLVCHRTTSPQDRKALKEWVQQHDEHDRGGKFLESLASLPQGDAWFWAPGLLDLFQRVHVRQRRTFDSSRTPKAGETIKAPTAFAPVDLEALRGQLARTIEDARDNDPKALRKEIARLERELSMKPTDAWESEDFIPKEDLDRLIRQAVDGALDEERRRSDAARHEIRHGLEEAYREIAAAGLAVSVGQQRLKSILDDDRFRAERVVHYVPPREGLRRPDPAPARAPRPDKPFPMAAAIEAGELSAPKIRILQAIVRLEALGIPKPTLIQVALMVGVSHTTGSYLQNVRELAGDGYLMRESGRVSLIETGRAAAGDVEIPTRRQLHEFWLTKLDGPQGKILRELLSSYPEALTIEQLGNKVGVSHTTGSFLQNVRELDKLGLVHRTKGRAAATELLFPRGLR